MIEIIKELNIEVSKPNVFQAVVAKQYDMNTRFIKATFVDGGDKIHIDHNATVKVVINALRPDGEAGAFEGEVNEDGTVTVPLHSWMLELVGTVTCDISVIDMETDDNKKLTTTSFTLLVEKAAYGGDGITSDPQYDLLIELLNSCSEAGATAEEALQKSNEAIARAEGVKGVYVGSGNMPNEYNVQIDPDGDALIVDTALDENSENLVKNKVVAKKINEIDAELSEAQTNIEDLQTKATKFNTHLWNNYLGADDPHLEIEGLGKYRLFAIEFQQGTNSTMNSILVYASATKSWLNNDIQYYGFDLKTVQHELSERGYYEVNSNVVLSAVTSYGTGEETLTTPQFVGTTIAYWNAETETEEPLKITAVIGVC